MWRTPVLFVRARRTYIDLDYARHMPKEYVEKVKRTVPKKIYSNRFGAPPIIRWTLHPDDYVPTDKRPWELDEFERNERRAQKYHAYKLNSKYFDLRREKSVAIPEEEWTIFPGDVVQVMVGKDKGKNGIVSHVIKETNAIFVKGRHTKLVNVQEGMESRGLKPFYMQQEQPLYAHKQQVMLVDPGDNEACEVEWKLDEESNEYVRISKRTGLQIPIPLMAYATSEYISPEQYVVGMCQSSPEVSGKDTPAKLALEKTYKPVLKSFEEEISDEMGIQDTRKLQPSYWY